MDWSYDAQRRISKNTRQSELHPKNKLDDPIPRSQWYQGKLAITTSVITAAGTGTLGKGTATFQLIAIDGSGNATYAAMPYPDVTVYNGGAEIASGLLIKVQQVDGVWFADYEVC